MKTSNVLFRFFFIASNVFLFSSGCKEYKEQNFYPVWGEGISAPFSQTVEIISTYTVFQTTEANVNAFNNHPIITIHNKKVHIAFSSHMNREDADGQYARYAFSKDGGITWTRPVTLLEPLCEMDSSREKLAARPAGWAVIDDDLYAVICILRGGTLMAIKVNDDSSFGEPFWIYPEFIQPEPFDNKPNYSYDPVIGPRIIDFLMKTENFPVRGFGWYKKNHFRNTEYFSEQESAYDFHDFVQGFNEPSGIVLPSGYELLLWRNMRRLREDREISPEKKRKFLKYRYGSTGEFSELQETEIIDSRSTTTWKILSDGRVGMMGNDTDANRTAIYYTEADPYDLVFDPVYNVLQNVDYNVKFPGSGKNGGASYVEFVEHEGNIICVYSERKEDIKVTVFKKP